MLSNRDLVAAVEQDQTNRAVWETRADQFYRMRHHGLRRKRKPFDGAADLHFPLADSFIERMRPAFFQQLYATDIMAQFVASNGQAAKLTNAASQWFDYQLKQKSNLESEILTIIDWMLMLGRPVMKVRWDVDKKQICFDAIDPRQIIVPSHTVDLDTADRIIHVRLFSQDHFKRTPEFENGKSEAVIQTLLAPADSEESGLSQSQASKETREGVLQDDDMIIVWEAWQPETNKGKTKWSYRCFSPMAPDITLKNDVESPYPDSMHTFVDFPFEVKDKGWYSPRGLVEMVATYEAELTNLLNQKHDALTLTNRPIFVNESGTQVNVNNFKLTPGQCLPKGIKPAIWPKPPFDFNDAIQMVREIAEGRVTVPDLGITRISDTTQRRTATEVNVVSNMFQQSSDLRMRIFRMSLGRLYRVAWKLLLEYAKKDLKYFYVDQFQEVPDMALHNDYAILPNGSADGVNKTFLFQKAVARFQMFNGNPYVNQGELAKSVLEVDDPAIVRRLYSDPGIKANDEREEQAMEIAIMAKGLPAVVSADDDHQAHLQAIAAYIQQNIIAQGIKPGVNEIPLLQRHIQEHLQALNEVNPKLAKAAMDAFGVLFQQLGAGQQQGQPVEQPQPTTTQP